MIDGYMRKLEKLEGVQFEEHLDKMVEVGLDFNTTLYLKADARRVVNHFRQKGDYEMRPRDHKDVMDEIFSFTHKPSGTGLTVYPFITPGMTPYYSPDNPPEYTMTIIVHPTDVSVPLDICRFIRDSGVPYYLPLEGIACRKEYPNGVHYPGHSVPLSQSSRRKQTQ